MQHGASAYTSHPGSTPATRSPLTNCGRNARSASWSGPGHPTETEIGESRGRASRRVAAGLPVDRPASQPRLEMRAQWRDNTTATHHRVNEISSASKYSYWALGHIHMRQQCPFPGPTRLLPGESPGAQSQARSDEKGGLRRRGASRASPAELRSSSDSHRSVGNASSPIDQLAGFRPLRASALVSHLSDADRRRCGRGRRRTHRSESRLSGETPLAPVAAQVRTRSKRIEAEIARRRTGAIEIQLRDAGVAFGRSIGAALRTDHRAPVANVRCELIDDASSRRSGLARSTQHRDELAADRRCRTSGPTTFARIAHRASRRADRAQLRAG